MSRGGDRRPKTSLATPAFVAPAKAGAQTELAAAARALDLRLRGDDEPMLLREHLVRRAGLRSSQEK